MLMLMCVEFYRPPKNLRKLTTRELPLVTLGEGVEGRPCAGRAMMILASSSYCAWDSRGSWPNRPKAHGAAVDVGNRENEEEDDIFFGGLGGRDDGCRRWRGSFGRLGWKSATLRGTACSCAYNCPS